MVNSINRRDVKAGIYVDRIETISTKEKLWTVDFYLSELPSVGRVPLTDMVNGIGMVTILLTIFGSIISSHFAEVKGKVKTARALDRISLVVFIAGLWR